MFDEFIAASQRREEQFRSRDEPQEEEEAAAPEPPFSIRAIVEEKVPAEVRLAIRFTWDEFRQLCEIAESSLLQTGSDRRRACEPID
jgi:hypothetical protein